MFAGLAKLQLGREEEAIIWLRRSVDANRNNPSVRFILGAALARIGRLPEARSEVRAGLVINPTFTIARFRAGVFSDDPAVAAGWERYVDGLREAGVPEE
jgi:tetratricopeptide (TPR) repeat protein